MITIAKISKMCGLQALTQGQSRIENLLLDNINQLGGNKVKGFNKTRLYVLTNEFDADSLEQVVQISTELHQAIGRKKTDKYIRLIMKQLLEKVFRDHVPLDMVEAFRLALAQRVELNGSSISKAIKEFEGYFTCGQIVPVAETYRHMCKELAEGRTIYLVPTES